MNQPGDRAMNGIGIDTLEVSPSISAKGAAELADELGAEPVNYAIPDQADRDGHPDWFLEIDTDFVINAIGFQKGDCFLYDSDTTRVETTIVEVVSTNQFSPGLEITNAQQHSIDMDWEELGSYGVLWVEWLRGNVIPLKESTEYIRQDTGDVVEV